MSEELDQVFLQLQREYLAEAPARLAELRDAAGRCLAGDPGALVTLRTHLHRLAGSGGSHGVPEVSDAARELERSLAGGPPTPDAAELSRGISRLETTFRDAAERVGSPGGATARGAPRAVAMMSPAPLRDQLVRGLEAEGYSVRIADRSEDPAAIPPAQFPDLLVIAAEAGQGDASAVASAWTAGATRPRAVVLIETLRAVDRLRASAAGIDAAFPEEQAAGALPPYARALARVGAPPRTVLVVGAEAERVEGLAAPLDEAGIRAVRCLQGRAVRESLEREVPDLLLASTTLGDADIEAVAQLVKGEPRFALLPIVIAGDGGETPERVAALRTVADDLVSGPLEPRRLLRAVIDQAERGRRSREARHRDPVTGILNAATLLAELEHEVEYRRRHGGSVALLVFGVEGLDRLAQPPGPEGGRRILLHVADVVRSSVRASDLIGRHGESDFGLVLRGGTPEGAAVVADKLHRVVGGRPLAGEGEPVPVRLRVGTACFPANGTTAAAVVRRAVDEMRGTD